jgi:hypothetical protein
MLRYSFRDASRVPSLLLEPLLQDLSGNTASKSICYSHPAQAKSRVDWKYCKRSEFLNAAAARSADILEVWINFFESLHGLKHDGRNDPQQHFVK